nr:GtrA family protein [uncultured Rhodopila sp.]
MAAFLRYAIAGGLALALHLIVLQSLLSIACPALPASAIGFVLACALNYTLQKLWVFRSSRAHAVALPRYVGITTVMLGVNTLLFGLLHGLGLAPLAAQTATTGCVFVLNFLGNRRFTFGAYRSEQIS